MSILLKNGNVVGSQMVSQQNILVENGVIAYLGKDTPEADKVIDLNGLTVLPGLIDMHVHLRDPGFTHKEDIHTGCLAAAAGGVTSIACMPNTNPVTDSVEVLEYILDKAKDAPARVYPVASITEGLKGDQLTDMKRLIQAGAVAFSDDCRPVENAAFLQQAMMEAERLGVKVISHCEDLNIINGGIINKGVVSEKLGLPGMDRTSEDSITAREIAIAAATDTSIHIAHVSTEGSVALIRDAKRRGVKVTAETCPHYFILTESKLLKKDADYRMNPPLREERDRLAVLEGVLDGTLDCIVTDHAPHTAEEKADFVKAPNGVVGLETSLAASLTALYHTGMLSLVELANKMSRTPAKILGIPGGKIAVGKPADLAIVDLDEEWTVYPELLHSKSKNTVFKGRSFRGRVKMTMCRGEIVYDIL